MRKTLTILLLLFIGIYSTAQHQGNISKTPENCKIEKGSCIQAIDSIKYELSPTEREGLIYMCLEEKLARDVYLTLGKTYKQKMFVKLRRASSVIWMP